jgi:hypothetical protein
MFLTLKDFLDQFPPITISRDEFVKKFIVTYVTNPSLDDLFNFKAKRVIKDDTDKRYINREAIIDYFYDIVIANRYTYLTKFYKSYFEVPNPYSLKWGNEDIYTEGDTKEICKAIDKFNNSINNKVINNKSNIKLNVKSNDKGNIKLIIKLNESIEDNLNNILDLKINSISMQKNDQSRRIIRNLNYLDILHLTKITNSVKCKTSFWQTFINLYNNLVLEDRLFTPACIDKCLEIKSLKGANETNYNCLYYHIQQYQPKASILNPYTINWILKNIFGNSGSLFTPVLSWCSYINAFMHSDFTEYVGVDVMQPVVDRVQFLFDYYQNELKPNLSTKEQQSLNKKTINLYCQPSESLDKKFISKYENHFDAVLMCPPYYNMEIYPNGQQSTDEYKSYDEWLIKYWEATVKLIHSVLKKPNGKFGFIVNDYKSLKDDNYPLINDLNMIVSKYFKLINVYHLVNRGSPLRVNFKNRTEMLFIWGHS